MSVALQFKLTQTGQAAVWNANNTGTSLNLTHIQFGSGNRAPSGTETALLTPQQAVAIAAGFSVSSTQIRMSAIFSGNQNYVVREVGLWAGDPAVGGSKLVGYWSQAAGDLAMKSPGVDFIFSHDMTLDAAVPAGSLTILADNAQSAMLAMITAHEAAANPHNQYATKAAVQAQTYTAFTTAGAAPTFTLAANPAIAAYAAGQRFRVKFGAAGNGADTLNVNALGAKSLKQFNQTGAKINAVITANQLVDIEYDGADFVLLDPIPGGLSAPFLSYGGTTTLTDVALGKAIALYGAAPYTLTLPVSAAANAGGVISFTAQQGSTTVTIAGQSSQTIQARGVAVSALAMQPGDTLMLVSGGGGWYVMGGSAQSGYAFSRHVISPASRVANTNYTNTTGKVMTIHAQFSAAAAVHPWITTGGTSIGDYKQAGDAGYGIRVTTVVLPGETYQWSYNNALAVPTLNNWIETY